MFGPYYFSFLATFKGTLNTKVKFLGKNMVLFISSCTHTPSCPFAVLNSFSFGCNPAHFRDFPTKSGNEPKNQVCLGSEINKL